MLVRVCTERAKTEFQNQHLRFQANRSTTHLANVGDGIPALQLGTALETGDAVLDEGNQRVISGMDNLQCACT